MGGVQLGVVKLMSLCAIQVEICSTPYCDSEIRVCFGAEIVDLGVTNLQIVFGTVKVNEITQD